MPQPKILLLIFSIFVYNNSRAQTWVNVGSPGFSADTATWTSIAIDGSGTPYVVYQDSIYGHAKVMKYNGTSWVNVGSPRFSASEADYTSIAIDNSGTPYVVYEDGGNWYKAMVMKYNGSSWVTVGSPGLSAGVAQYTSIAINSSGIPYVVYMDQSTGTNQATVMKYNDTNWVTVGSAEFSAAEVEYTSIAIDGNDTPYVVYQDEANGEKATVMKFNGSDWVPVGSPGFSAVAVEEPSIAIDGSGTPYVVYVEAFGPVTVMKYNGSSWVTVGAAGFSAGVAPMTISTSIAIDNSGTPYVVFSDNTNTITPGPATVMKLNGSTWVIEGSAGFSVGSVNWTTMAINSSRTPYVVYEDFGNSGKATLMKLNTAIHNGVKNTTHPPTSLTISPNPNQGSFTLLLSTPTNELAPITITNMLGEKIKEYNVPTNQETTVQLDAPPGMYFLTAISGEGVESTKVVVR